MVGNARAGLFLPGHCVVQFDGHHFPKRSIPGYIRPLSNSEISLNDVLIDGSGGYGHIHPGNLQLRSILAQQKKTLLECSNTSYGNVMDVASCIVGLLRRLDPPGRFLEKNVWTGCWKDIGVDRAREIVSLALSDFLPIDRAENDGTQNLTREHKAESIDYAPFNTLKTRHQSGQLRQVLDVVPSMKEKSQNCAETEFKQSVQHGKQHLTPCSVERTSLAFEDMRLPKEYAVFQGYVPEPIILPKEGGMIPTSELTCNDVLSGRGNLINSHVGNIQFRNIVAHHKEKYKDSTNKRIEKTFAAARVVAIVRSFTPPGRFLRKDDKSDSWIEIGDENARLKAGQALRDSVGEDKVEKKRKVPADPSSSLKEISLEEQSTISTLIMLSRNTNSDNSYLKKPKEGDSRAGFDQHYPS